MILTVTAVQESLMTVSKMRVMCPYCNGSGETCYCFGGDGCGADDCPLLGDPYAFVPPPVPKFRVDN